VLSVRFEVGVSLLLAPLELIKEGPLPSGRKGGYMGMPPQKIF